MSSSGLARATELKRRKLDEYVWKTLFSMRLPRTPGGTGVSKMRRDLTPIANPTPMQVQPGQSLPRAPYANRQMVGAGWRAPGSAGVPALEAIR